MLSNEKSLVTNPLSSKTLPRVGTEEQVDTQAVAAYCVGGDGGFVSYDNPETVRMKGDFAKARGLAVSADFTSTSNAHVV